MWRPLRRSNFLSTCRHYSCSNGDTWSSELGVLSSGNPILITSLRRVPKGTNGGVSALGMVASIIAGFVIGVAYFISSSLVLGSPSEWPIILVATIAAPLGSLVRAFRLALASSTAPFWPIMFIDRFSSWSYTTILCFRSRAEEGRQQTRPSAQTY